MDEVGDLDRVGLVMGERAVAAVSRVHLVLSTVAALYLPLVLNLPLALDLSS